MVLIKGGSYQFVVSGNEIEGGDAAGTLHMLPFISIQFIGVDVQYPWETYPQRHHKHQMNVTTFGLDRYPVTNQQFKTFLEQSAYQPKDPQNFLRHWINGTFPQGWQNKPVIWVLLFTLCQHVIRRVSK